MKGAWKCAERGKGVWKCAGQGKGARKHAGQGGSAWDHIVQMNIEQDFLDEVVCSWCLDVE